MEEAGCVFKDLRGAVLAREAWSALPSWPRQCSFLSFPGLMASPTVFCVSTGMPSPSVSPAATGMPTPATGTTGACSSLSQVGWPPEAGSTRLEQTWLRKPSRSQPPRGLRGCRAWMPGPALEPRLQGPGVTSHHPGGTAAHGYVASFADWACRPKAARPWRTAAGRFWRLRWPTCTASTGLCAAHAPWAVTRIWHLSRSRAACNRGSWSRPRGRRIRSGAGARCAACARRLALWARGWRGARCLVSQAGGDTAMRW